jgi:excinuclease ABC subunit B
MNLLEVLRQEMTEAAENLEFEKASHLRDEIKKLEDELGISKKESIFNLERRS